MANRRSFIVMSGLTIVGRAGAFILLAHSATHAASTRLPWAATSGIHFVEAVVNADNYRAKAGGLAMKKSPSPDVRDFGHALWTDSIEDTRRLRWVLDKADPHVLLPTTVTPQYMFVIDELLPVTGDDFDRRFIALQTASLTQALALARAYARFGDDFELKDYAARSAPKIEARLEQIREIEMRVGRMASSE